MAQIEKPELKQKRTPYLSSEANIDEKYFKRGMGEKHLDEVVIAILKQETPYKWECPECGAEFFRKVYEKELKASLEREENKGEEHLLFQLDQASELAYWSCINCENPVDFSGGVQR